MSRETEKVFKELHKAMDAQEFENEEHVNEFMKNFMDEYNSKVHMNSKLDSYDYLRMADEADSAQEAIKYAQKALKMDKFCLEADMILAQAKAGSAEEYKKNLQKVIQKGEKQLIELGIDKQEEAGHFYSLFETRPYMRARKTYLELLLEMGMFRSAIKEAEELLYLNENDNLGVRYSLMALYCYFEDENKAIELYQKYKSDGAFMLLPIIALYYKMENYKKMRSYILKLKKSIPDLAEGLEIIMSGDEEELSQYVFLEMYRPFSIEEVVLAFSEASYLYSTMHHFLIRLYEEVVK